MPSAMSDRRRSYTDQRYVHFVTFSIFRRRRLLDLDQPKRITLRVLNYQLEALSAKRLGFVLMPDHVHGLIWLSESNQLRRFLHGWKWISSFEIRRWYAEQARNYSARFGQGDRFWQPKYHAFQIYSEQKLTEKLDYMHQNPVRAGLVQAAVDRPWSSARWYLRHQSVGVPISWIN